MIQRDALYSELQQLGGGGGNMRPRGSFSYETSASDPDLKEQIQKLREMRNSPFWNRSLSDIAGMILLEHIPKEIEKYKRQLERRED